MTKTCNRCKAWIPEGRTYCDAHYNEALAEYENAMASYYRNLDNWNSMDYDQRQAAHKNAETGNVGTHAAFVALGVGGAIWYTLAQRREIDFLWGCGIMVASWAVIYGIDPVRILAGRLARSIVTALGWAFGLGVISLIVYFFSAVARKFLDEHHQMAWVCLAVVSIVIGLITEISGENHASGAPTPPSKPNP
jgi:hypothetical protein